VVAEQDLGHCQAQQFAVGQAGAAAGAKAWVGADEVVDEDVQCGDEVVETGVHGASLEVDVAGATPTLGGLVLLVMARHPRVNSESIIQ